MTNHWDEFSKSLAQPVPRRETLRRLGVALAGEGAGLAMAEAYVLAGELNRAGDDYQGAFRRYEQLLRPFVEGRQKSARYFASAFVPKTRIGVWLRNQVTKLMALRPIAHCFLGRQLRDDFDLPNYDDQVPSHQEPLCSGDAQ